MIKSQTITVKLESNKQRLDIFLSEKLEVSRSQIQKIIKDELVVVNSKLPKKGGDGIKNGDKIRIKKKTIKKTKQEVVLKKKKTRKFNIKDIKIIEQNDDYLVVNKPSGLLIHPTPANEKNTLSKIILEKYPEIANVGENPVRPGIVHRLDKDASGIMVVTRTQKMFDHLKKQFKKRKIDKEYLVLVHGIIEADHGIIDFPLVRSRASERMAALPVVTSKDGLAKLKDVDKTKHLAEQYKKSRDALTEFWIEKRYINFTLLRVKIHTGRMHQIRAHFLAYNHPVIGDKIYFQKKLSNRYDKAAGRIFLHSSQLGFSDLKKKKQLYSCRLPKELQSFLKTYDKK